MPQYPWQRRLQDLPVQALAHRCWMEPQQKVLKQQVTVFQGCLNEQKKNQDSPSTSIPPHP